ncbi:hypothetical protein ACJMK2_035095 [Sinanodonta woodiana]|uniref:Uncharacterized protein n=1 Tax=Sinanodonta woodiana TaxID=1069815 RepID=A0ABD3WUA4_SINWO
MAEKKKRLPDDVVEYTLFPPIPVSLKQDGIRNFLEECADSYMTFLSSLLIDYIWQNEPFVLKPVIEVVDSDEEFLLIEAANVLPKWLNPDTAENRVYIYNGQLHIIPVPQSPFVRKNESATTASSKIQKVIKDRIKDFPSRIQESFHYAYCYVPASLAAILKEKPQLVAPAVQAFYYRDPIDLKCCRTFTYFRPGTRVMTRVKFTRCLYAQLIQQNFQSDKRSGYVLPSTSNPNFKAHDLGMKLAHGFEILCAKCSSRPATEAAGHSVGSSPSEGDIRWQRYIKSLKDKNYFRGELEGSKLYNELLGSAWKFYQENISHQKSPSRDAGGEILFLLGSVKYNVEEMRRAESSLPPADDDSWMDLTPETLDKILKKRSGKQDIDLDINESAIEGSINLSSVAKGMESFIEKVSGLDGAEFPSDYNDDDDDDDIKFETSGFINSMQKMFEFEDTMSASSSDMSEYDWDELDDDRSKRQTKIKRPPSLDQYMDVMDRELAKTDVGKSFEKQQKTKPKPDANKATPRKTAGSKGRDINDEDDDFQPVDVDLNTVKNMLESLGAQQGLPGPASNILNTMGIVLPPPKEDGSSDMTPTPTEATPSPCKPRRQTPF